MTSINPVTRAINSGYNPAETDVPANIAEGMTPEQKTQFRAYDAFASKCKEHGIPHEHAGCWDLKTAPNGTTKELAKMLDQLSPEDQQSVIEKRLTPEMQTQLATFRQVAANKVERQQRDEMVATIPAMQTTINAQAEEIKGLKEAQQKPANAPSMREQELEARLAELENAAATKEAEEAEEAGKSDFMRGLGEIFEFIGRFFTPFWNMVSAVTRLVKVCYNLLKGEKIDWTEEGLRMAGDIAGVFFPPAGAIANAGLNIYYDDSEILGGINELYDDADKDNYFRRQGEGLVDGAKGLYDGAVDATKDALRPWVNEGTSKEAVAPQAPTRAQVVSSPNIPLKSES
jgi:hypothetical protein